MAPKSGPNSAAPTTAEIVGGVYNAAGETLVDGQATPLQTDVHGNLLVNVAVNSGGGGTSNVNIADVSGSPPALSNPLPVELSDGTNAIGVAGNPLVVTPSGGTQTVVGNKTNNNAVPGATNVGTLPALANAATPVWTEGDQVALSVDLSGAQRENVAEWGGTAVQAAQTSSTGATGANPEIRSIPRRFSQVLTSTPLAANAAFTSAWFDTNQTGSMWLEVGAISNVNGASAGYIIQQSDDQVNIINLTASAAGTGGTDTYLTANGYQVDYAPLTRRYWRVSFKNGATLQASFSLIASEYSSPVFPSVLTGSGFYGSPAFGVAALATVAISNPTVAVFNNNQGINVAPMVGLGVTTQGGQSPSVTPMRTPVVFKTASVPATASGNTAIWTPTSGTKFRLMRFQINATNLVATVATIITISFQDSAAGITIGTYDVLMPAAATATNVILGGVTDISNGWIDLGNGFLSAAANNVLNANISATVTGATGSFRVNVCGTEE